MYILYNPRRRFSSKRLPCGNLLSRQLPLKVFQKDLQRSSLRHCKRLPCGNLLSRQLPLKVFQSDLQRSLPLPARRRCSKRLPCSNLLSHQLPFEVFQSDLQRRYTLYTYTFIGIPRHKILYIYKI